MKVACLVFTTLLLTTAYAQDLPDTPSQSVQASALQSRVPEKVERVAGKEPGRRPLPVRCGLVLARAGRGRGRERARYRSDPPGSCSRTSRLRGKRGRPASLARRLVHARHARHRGNRCLGCDRPQIAITLCRAMSAPRLLSTNMDAEAASGYRSAGDGRSAMWRSAVLCTERSCLTSLSWDFKPKGD